MNHSKPIIARSRRFVAAACITASALTLCSAALAEETVTVPKQEWEELKRQMSEMRRRLEKVETAPPAPAATNNKLAGSVTDPKVLKPSGSGSPLFASFSELANAVELGRPGENKFLLTGSLEGAWQMEDQFHTSGFSASFSPIFLWHLTDRLSVEAEVELELEDHDTKVNLEYAQLDWQLTDYFSLVLGKFLSPMNIFVERYEPKWINKLPDTPLGIYDGFLPESNVGIQLRGAVPLGYPGGKLMLSAFASNAPSYSTSLDSPGEIDFDNFNSGRHNIAVGGRIGWQLCPNFEVGYGIQYSKAQADDGSGYDPLLNQSVDLQGWVDAAKGRWTLLGQYAFSHFQKDHIIGTLDDGSQVQAGFPARQDGGYVQLSYRGKTWDTDFLNRLEFIARGDRTTATGFSTRLDAPIESSLDFITTSSHTPGTEANRFTFGIDYWLTTYTVLKAAYEHTTISHGGGNADTLLIGFATGL